MFQGLLRTLVFGRIQVLYYQHKLVVVFSIFIAYTLNNDDNYLSSGQLVEFQFFDLEIDFKQLKIQLLQTLCLQNIENILLQLLAHLPHYVQVSINAFHQTVA